MPASSSILWKPLRDSHYVVASLQPGHAGRRLIFVKQAVLARVQALARRSAGRHALGLLVGRRWECPITGKSYLLIDSTVDGAAAIDSRSLATAITELAAQYRGHESETLGWYSATASVDGRLSRTHAEIHTESFPQPWQTALVVDESGSAGAFFLHDALAARWFQTPFYEFVEPARGQQRTKPTCISWPDYLTTEPVVPLGTYPPPPQSAPRAAVPAAPPARTKPAQDRAARTHGRELRRSMAVVSGAWKTTQGQLHNSSARLGQTVSKRAVGLRSLAARVGKAVADRASASARVIVSLITSAGAYATPKGERASKPAGSPESRVRARGAPARLAVFPNAGVSSSPGTDPEDTTPLDRPYRYLALAGREGFVVSARSQTGDAYQSETFWVLDEPESGILLTVVTTDHAVREATLHYNLRTENDALLRSTPREHRDLDSRTIYVRESAVERLRARCKHLRATGDLVREWKVSPPIHLPHPSRNTDAGSIRVARSPGNPVATNAAPASTKVTTP